jgi:energy-coupling factor transport system substrate-specific component
VNASRVLSRALFTVVTLMGVGAFVYPFFLSEVQRTSEQFSHAGDAPVLFAIFAPVLLLVAVVEVRAGRLDAKQVALLGILGGINAVLRIPTGLAGAKLIYLLPILCGYAFGPGFGFLLGAATMGVSSVITGGVGPWVPFQMWALGWVGGGAGLLRPLLSRAGRGGEIGGLVGYAWLAGYFYGALMNLWFWPYLGALSDQLSWRPGLGLWETLGRYWRFYIATSLHWDSAAALTNALMIAVLGRPVLRVLARFRLRFTPPVFEGPSKTPAVASPGRV